MNSSIRDLSLAESGRKKIEWVKSYMPILTGLEEEFRKTRPFEGVKISLSVHLEAKPHTCPRYLPPAGQRCR